MNLTRTPKIIKLTESIKLGKQYVEKQLLSKEELDVLVGIDPSTNKKHVGWLAKIFIQDKPDMDDLRNSIEEFATLVQKGKIKKDINSFKTLKELQVELEQLNSTGATKTNRELEEDFEVILDNEHLYIAVPHTHEASRKLGLTKFSFRSCDDGNKDSAWCTTYKTADHFESYYYSQNVTFYYILIKSDELMAKVLVAFPSKPQFRVVALAVLDSGKMDGYDGLDKQLSSQDIKKYRQIIGL